MSRNYATQKEAAVKGIITPEMETVAAYENIDVEVLRERMARGTVVIPANINHKNLKPMAVGEGLSTKINVNLGISQDCCDYDLELGKVKLAEELEAHAVMDLSCWGKTADFRKRLIEESSLMVGTVPLYDVRGNKDKPMLELTVDDYFEVAEQHAREGVDFLTIHAGLNRKTAQRLKDNKRVTNIVSRGGAILFTWMEVNDKENPFYEHYDRLLDICRKYDVTLSLGDGCRPGCLADATDACQIEELITLGELTKRAWEKDVQVMIEGPGHMAMNEIAPNMIIQKRLCHGAPFYVLGPLVTDIAPGYDHITSAIGGAIAAQAGADFLCYVTPAEHLKLPDLDNVREGIIASKIAAHAADIATGHPGARDIDDRMGKARAELNWEEMFNCSMDPEKARRVKESSPTSEDDVCTMCGDMCAVRNMNEILDKSRK